LSLLAVAEAEYLDFVRPKLLPHKLSLDHRLSSPTPGRGTSPATQTELELSIANDIPLAANSSSRNSVQLETLDDRELFAAYTTLEDADRQTASADTEMPDHLDDEAQENTRNLTNRHSMSNDQTAPTLNNDRPDVLVVNEGLNASAGGIINYTDAANPILVSHAERTLSASSPQSSVSSSLTPVLNIRYPWFWEQLDSLYGGSSEHALQNIPDIIRLGDHFLRQDVASFVAYFYSKRNNGEFWHRPRLSNIAKNGTIMQRLLRGLHDAETLDQNHAVDTVQLRLSRVILYHYFEKLCIDYSGQKPRGKTTASVVTDKVLDELYSAETEPCWPRSREQKRQSFHRHKKIGKRWSIVATHLGLGILLTCSPSFEAQM